MVKMMDLTGQKYGDWNILHREGITKSGFAIWVCECKCGNRKPIPSQHIIHKIAKKHCGCDQDWTGKKFGRLTVLNKISGKGNHVARFLCACECGNEKTVFGGSLHQGTTESCGCIKARSEQHICITIAYGGYQRHAKVRNIEFDLSKEDFLKICLQKCFYCGEESSNVTRRKTKNDKDWVLKHNGIDRYDNNQGYDLKNCVACCKICNIMKKNFSVDFWISHMEKIVKKMALT